MAMRRKKKKILGIDKRENKILATAIILMIILLLAVLAVKNIIDATKKFEYLGLKFQKIKYGELNLFYSKFQIDREGGYIINTQYKPLAPVNYNLYLRNDPRTNNISVLGNVEFANPIIISSDAEVGKCDDAGIAGISLGQFLSAMGIDLQTGVADKELANQTNKPYVTCESYANYSGGIIMLREGNETYVKRSGGSCYTIYIADCEIVRGVERFILAMIESTVKKI